MITERQAEQITETLCSVAVRLDDHRCAPDALRTIRRALVEEIDELNRARSVPADAADSLRSDRGTIA